MVSTRAEPVERALAKVPAIIVDRASKSFRIPHDQLLTFKERALHPVQAFRGVHDELRAMDDMSFEVAHGEFFGIVGRNGSGKSTLLKCIAGIYDIDRGDISVTGRLSPFIELGVGFNPDLTARDNVIVNAIMLGLSRREARERFDDIIAFAELDEFVDLRLKNYSSGMQVRLAFSVAIQVEADVLLIDEVLAVGDASFQQKCFGEFTRLKEAGKTIVFVTHDMGAAERYCDRAMLIERGEVMSIDEPATIAKKYNELNFGRMLHAPVDGDGERYGDQKEGRILDTWFEDASGARVSAVAQGEPLALCMEVLFEQEVHDPIFAVSIRNEMRQTIFATSTAQGDELTGMFAAGRRVQIRVSFENWLAPSLYTATPSIAKAGPGADVYDVREDLAQIVIHGARFTGGVTDLPHRIDIERA